MKKIIKICWILLFNIFLIILLSEMTIYINAIREDIKVHIPNIKYLDKSTIIEIFTKNYKYTMLKYQNFDDFYNFVRKYKFRKPLGLEYKNKPIIVFGGSFAWGFGLKDNENFAAHLSSLMQCPVYNRSYEMWWGPQNMLYQAQREDFYKEVPEPQYVIYILIEEHYLRAATKSYGLFSPYPYLHYSLDNKYNIKREKNEFLQNFITYRQFSFDKATRIDWAEKQILFNKIFNETKKEFDKHWKNYKFIILIYEENEETKENFHNRNLEALANNGFIIISVYDLVGRIMNENDDFIFDKCHPNSNTWNIITTALVKELKNK